MRTLMRMCTHRRVQKTRREPPCRACVAVRLSGELSIELIPGGRKLLCRATDRQERKKKKKAYCSSLGVPQRRARVMIFHSRFFFFFLSFFRNLHRILFQKQLAAFTVYKTSMQKHLNPPGNACEPQSKGQQHKARRCVTVREYVCIVCLVLCFC